MAFLPTMSSPTTMDDLYVHPFFRMDDDHSHKSPRSSGVMVARPMSISSPGEIIKLDLGGGKKTPPLQTSPIMKRFRGETDDMLEWNYRSEEELASPCTNKDDLSSRPSFSTIDDDDYDDQVSLVDDDDDIGDVDEDDLELLADFGLASSASDSILPAEQTQSQTCEQCTHAEAVKIIRPGQAKVVLLSKPPGSPHATVVRRSSFTSSPPHSPFASASNEPRMASNRNSVAMSSSLDRNASISSGKAASMASSNGHSTTSASGSEGNSSGNESLASSQPSSTTTTTGTSIGESMKTISSLSPTPPQRRRRPSLPFLQIKPEAPHVWTMGLPTPQSAKKAANDAPSSKRNSLVSPLSFSFPTSSSTDASIKKGSNNTNGSGSKAKISNPISLRSMWSAARPLRRKNNLTQSSNTNTNTPSKTDTSTGHSMAETDSSLSKTINRRSGQSQAPPPSPTTSSGQHLASSATTNGAFAGTTSRLIPRPANARAPPPVLPPFPRSSRLSFAERVEDQLDVSEGYDGYLRYSAIDPLEHCDADDLAELAELADLMHPGFGFLQQDGACQSSSSSAAGLAAAAALVNGDSRSGYEYPTDATVAGEATVDAAFPAEMFTGTGAGLFTLGTPTFDAESALPETSTAVEAST